MEEHSRGFWGGGGAETPLHGFLVLGGSFNFERDGCNKIRSSEGELDRIMES